MRSRILAARTEGECRGSSVPFGVGRQRSPASPRLRFGEMPFLAELLRGLFQAFFQLVGVHHRDHLDARVQHLEEGLGDRVSFATATAKTFPSNDYDLVCFFDCLHDMGDPVGAARHVLETLNKDGSWMIVEPFAHDRVEENLNPIGRLFYAASTMICVPASLSQDVGMALGAQAGEDRLREVVMAGGFTRFRRASATPFNLVLEARP